MEEQIAHFTEQFSWKPDVLHTDQLPPAHAHTVVAGMGGSHLGARLLLRHDPTLPISIHSDYGLPRQPYEQLAHTLVIASSYSGETEETLDAARAAVEAGIATAVVTTGGTLADFARTHKLPLVLLPKLSVEPRMAVGASMLAIARLMGNQALEDMIRETGSALDTGHGRAEAEALASGLADATPVLYASTLNHSIAYFWKIALNETGKIPAFYNIFPELCHNELSGYDTTDAAHGRITRLHVLLLTDTNDHPRIAARMHVLKKLLTTRDIAVTETELVGATPLEKAFNGVLAGVWFALAVAKRYDAPDAATPLIGAFKNAMKNV